jgi:hypothetical protein
MSTYLGKIEIRKEITDYLGSLKNELTHYKEGVRWMKEQNGVPTDFTDEVNAIFKQMKESYDIEMKAILDTARLPYPNAAHFELGDGIAHVWGN